MGQTRLYVDEDAMHGIIVQGLISRNVDVVTATSANMVNREDEDHLMVATGLGRALYSHTGGDYQRLHTKGCPRDVPTSASFWPRSSAMPSERNSTGWSAWEVQCRLAR